MTAPVAPEPSVVDTLRDEALGADPATVDPVLIGAPMLKPWKSMRPRQKRPIFEAATIAGDADADSILGNFDALIAVDEALESIAVDPAAYAEWAKVDDARIIALFAQYMEESGVGEASSSTR